MVNPCNDAPMLKRTLRTLAFLLPLSLAFHVEPAALAQAAPDAALVEPGAGSSVGVTATPGSATGSGALLGSSAPAPAANPQAGPAQPLPTALPNLGDHPLDFIAAVKVFWSQGGWGIGLMVGLLGLLEALALAGVKFNVAWLAWLGKGRISIVLSGATTVLTTAIAAFSSGGWLAFLTSAVGAALGIWHPAGTDPTKAINPVTEEPPVVLPAARVVK